MTINGATRIIAIIGDPVSHTRSPEMHNAAFEALGLNFCYVPFPVAPSDLPDAVRGLRSLGVAGFNVTIPHKEAILPLLDDCSPEALLIGAVNTVVVRGRRLVGYNTDGTGLVRSLERDLHFLPRGKRILLIGAGGAARSALVALAREGASRVVVINRDQARAGRLVETVKDCFMGVDIRVESMEILGDDSSLAGFDLVVNATSVGLHGECFERFHPAVPLMGYDMVYATRETPFVETIRSVPGGRAVMGHGMLASQGEEAFHLWTGVRPPEGLLMQVLSTRTDRNPSR